MLQRGIMNILDLRPDRVLLPTSSATNAASVEADLRPRKNPLERILSVVGDFCPEEGLGTLILTINLFTPMCGFYFLKSVRELLILAEGGEK